MKDYTYKLDKHLSEKLNEIEDEETIPVSVWISDIEYDEVYTKTVKELTNKIKNKEISEKSIDWLSLFMSDVSNKAKISTSSILKNKLTLDIAYNEFEVYNNISDEDLQISLETKRKISKDLYTENNNHFLDEIITKQSLSLFSNVNEENNVLYVSSYAPNVDLNLTKSQILQLIQNENVYEVYNSSYNDSADYISENLVSEVEIEQENAIYTTEDDIDNYTYWQNITGITQLKSTGVKATNRKIGLLEISTPYVEQNSDIYSDYYDVFAHMFDEENPENNRMIYRESDQQILTEEAVVNNRWHAINTASVLVGDSEYCEGIVPEAKLYCASECGEGGQKGAFEWLIDQGVRVICENNGYLLWYYQNNYYSEKSKWIDHISYMHGVTVVLPAGNSRKADENGQGYYTENENSVLTNAMSYNAIVVGNYDYELNVACSSYNGLETLPFKPDVVAPGCSIGTPIGEISTGTSLSNPITTGIVALLCSNSYCYTNPCLVKALLLASADYRGEYNNSNGSINSGFDRSTGAGIVNVSKAYQILQSYTETQNPEYDYDFGYISTQNGLTSSSSFEVTNTNNDICFSYVWMKMNTLATPHETSTAVDAEYPSIKVTITAPNGDVFNSYYANDCKANVVFSPTCTGTYIVSYELMNDFVLDTSMKYATAICRVK